MHTHAHARKLEAVFCIDSHSQWLTVLSWVPVAYRGGKDSSFLVQAGPERERGKGCSLRCRTASLESCLCKLTLSCLCKLTLSTGGNWCVRTTDNNNYKIHPRRKGPTCACFSSLPFTLSVHLGSVILDAAPWIQGGSLPLSVLTDMAIFFENRYA